MKLIDFKNGASLPAPLYVSEPYVILSKENVVLAAGTADEIRALGRQFGTYYDDCELRERRHDMHANDNNRVRPAGEAPQTKPKPICLGWKNGVLTYKIGVNTVEITGDETFNQWERCRLNGGEWMDCDPRGTLPANYAMLGGKL